MYDDYIIRIPDWPHPWPYAFIYSHTGNTVHLLSSQYANLVVIRGTTDYRYEKVVVMTTYVSTSDNKVGIITTIGLQCYWLQVSKKFSIGHRLETFEKLIHIYIFREMLSTLFDGKW